MDNSTHIIKPIKRLILYNSILTLVVYCFHHYYYVFTVTLYSIITSLTLLRSAYTVLIELRLLCSSRETKRQERRLRYRALAGVRRKLKARSLS